MSLKSAPTPLIRKETRKFLQFCVASHHRVISSLCPSRLHATSPCAASNTPQPAVLTRRPRIACSTSGSSRLHFQSRHVSALQRKKSQTGSVNPDLKFTSSDVPIATIWDQKRQELLKDGMEVDATRLDSEACVKEAIRFAEEVAKAGDGWRPNRAKDLRFSASDLYYMAVLLLAPPVESVNTQTMSKQMLISAAFMDHGPAVITMMNLALLEIQRKGQRGLPRKDDAPEFWRIVGRFNKYAQHVKQDPDALTLSGLLALAQSDRAKAIKYLSAAETAGRAQSAACQGDHQDTPTVEDDSSTMISTAKPRRLRWDLEAQTLMGLGVLHEKSGDMDGARDAFLTAARDLDIPEACLRLGLLLSPDDPVEAADREILLTRAAMSGVEHAYAPLAEMEETKAAAAEAAGSLKAAARHKAMSNQWVALALGE